jgi:hypothetical protein
VRSIAAGLRARHTGAQQRKYAAICTISGYGCSPSPWPEQHSRELGIDDAIVNFLGSGCSLGHPVAMTGARMVLTLVHELRRRGGGIGVAAMCAGGGMASALVLDVPAPKR